MKKVLLGVNSGIGAKDTIRLVYSLLEKYEVKLVITDRSSYFFNRKNIEKKVEIFDDNSEWYNWKSVEMIFYIYHYAIGRMYF